MHVLKAPATATGSKGCCKDVVRIGRVRFLRDFYENIILTKSRQPEQAFYVLDPNVHERVRIFESIIISQRV